MGKGSYAKVYLIEWINDKKLFAAKIFVKNHVMQNSCVRKGLINEIEILWKLNHPNLLQFLELYESGKYICFVMEYC